MEADAFHCPRSNGSEALAAARQAQITNTGRAPCRTSRQTCAKVGLLIMAEPPPTTTTEDVFLKRAATWARLTLEKSFAPMALKRPGLGTPGAAAEMNAGD